MSMCTMWSSLPILWLSDVLNNAPVGGRNLNYHRTIIKITHWVKNYINCNYRIWWVSIKLHGRTCYFPCKVNDHTLNDLSLWLKPHQTEGACRLYSHVRSHSQNQYNVTYCQKKALKFYTPFRKLPKAVKKSGWCIWSGVVGAVRAVC